MTSMRKTYAKMSLLDCKKVILKLASMENIPRKFDGSICLCLFGYSPITYIQLAPFMANSYCCLL